MPEPYLRPVNTRPLEMRAGGRQQCNRRREKPCPVSPSLYWQAKNYSSSQQFMAEPVLHGEPLPSPQFPPWPGLCSHLFAVGECLGRGRAQAHPIPLGRSRGRKVRELEQMKKSPRGLEAGLGQSKPR